MLTFEQAKQLKDAGFPMDECESWLGWSERYGWQPDIKTKTSRGFLPNPTLSELIKACGPRFRALEKVLQTDGFGGWRCRGVRWEDMFWGKTPEEAVIELYLSSH